MAGLAPINWQIAAPSLQTAVPVVHALGWQAPGSPVPGSALSSLLDSQAPVAGLQASCVHGLVSLHAMSTFWQEKFAGVQMSVVHGFESSQS